MAGLVVHEWFESFGGSERVVNSVLDAFPTASTYCLWDDRSDIPRGRTTQSWMAKTPLRNNKALALPLMPFVWKKASDTLSYEWCFISSHLFAHHFQPRFNGTSGKTVVYVHSPARYIWEPTIDSRGNNLAARLSSPFFRSLDSASVDSLKKKYLANSYFVRQRIEKHWGIDSEVVYPPVNVKKILNSSDQYRQQDGPEMDLLSYLPAEYVSGVSRFVDYKRLDQVIQFGETVGLPVVLIGSGPLDAKIRYIAENAKVQVLILSNLTDWAVSQVMSRSVALIYPALEDFGIVPVEAMAAGTPVIAQSRGGTSETVKENVSGFHLPEFRPEYYSEALDAVRSLSKPLIQKHALQFDESRFIESVLVHLDA